jgi:hypothetical protein
MRRRILAGLGVLMLSAVVAASAGATGDRRSDGRSCTYQRLAGVITAVAPGGVAVQVPGQAQPMTFRLLAQTRIRKHDQPVGVTALAVGQKVMIYVRTCKGAGGPTEVALAGILLSGDKGAPNGNGESAPPTGTTAPTTAPTASSCARGDFTAPVASVGADGITFTSNGAEGAKSFSVGVNGDTQIRKNDAAITLAAIAPGDKLHVWVVRCPGSPATLKAIKIVDLGPAAVTTNTTG